MRTRGWIVATAVVVGCGGWFGRSVLAGDPPNGGGPAGGGAGGPPDFMALMTPGEEHARLAKFAGEWASHTVLHMGPGQDVQSDSTATFKMIMGGRYLQEDVTGTMMGMPFEGRGTFGFDNATKTYFSSWFDNFGTGITNSTGKETEKGKVWVFTGDMNMGQGPQTMEQTWTMVSDKEFTLTMKAGGQAVMEITSKKK